MDDVELQRRIETLRGAVCGWATRRELWRDAWFKSFQQHFDEKPEIDPVVLVFCFDSGLVDLFGHYRSDSGEAIEEFDAVVNAAGFWWTLHDHTSIKFYSQHDQAAFYAYFRFQWICSLLAPDVAGVSDELFRHFRDRPDDLRKIEPRSLEILLSSAFGNQGFRSELGPGVGDGGVDIRLYQHDVIGDVLTLVQVKRYAKDRPIGLEAVAALHSLVTTEKANRGLFVTTSRFLPGTRSYAERDTRVIQLADTRDMVRWCADAEAAIAKARDPIALDEILTKVKDGRPCGGLIGTILHATWGYGMTINKFALIVRETPGAVLLAPLAKQVVHGASGDVAGQEIAQLVFELTEDGRRTFIAKKKSLNGSLGFWGDGDLYDLWDGSPKRFNYVD